MEFGEDIRSCLPLTVHQLHWPISAIVRNIVFVFLQCGDLFSVRSATYDLKLIHRARKTLQCEIIIQFFQMD